MGKLYIVVRFQDGAPFAVCSNGRHAYIGSSVEAHRLKARLMIDNPLEKYEVFSATPAASLLQRADGVEEPRKKRASESKARKMSKC